MLTHTLVILYHHHSQCFSLCPKVRLSLLVVYTFPTPFKDNTNTGTALYALHSVYSIIFLGECNLFSSLILCYIMLIALLVFVLLMTLVLAKVFTWSFFFEFVLATANCTIHVFVLQPEYSGILVASVLYLANLQTMLLYLSFAYIRQLALELCIKNKIYFFDYQIGDANVKKISGSFIADCKHHTSSTIFDLNADFNFVDYCDEKILNNYINESFVIVQAPLRKVIELLSVPHSKNILSLHGIDPHSKPVKTMLLRLIQNDHSCLACSTYWLIFKKIVNLFLI